MGFVVVNVKAQKRRSRCFKHFKFRSLLSGLFSFFKAFKISSSLLVYVFQLLKVRMEAWLTVFTLF
jgi:hypothetical protein